MVSLGHQRMGVGEGWMSIAGLMGEAMGNRWLRGNAVAWKIGKLVEAGRWQAQSVSRK